MRSLIILALLMLAINIKGIGQEEKNSTADTLEVKESFTVVPYIKDQSFQNSSVSVYQVNDPTVLQFSNGQSILNSLTGQVPNMSQNRNGYNSRLGTPLLVIDGVGFTSDWSNYANFNAFDFEKVSVNNSSNLTPIIGGAAAQGAFVLQTKSGKNVTRPIFTFNESINYSWFKSEGLNGEDFSQEWWTFTSSLAYSQDFGKVDTRISYHLGNAPDDGLGSNTHTIRINTGFDISPKFSARLILDDNLYSRTDPGNTLWQIPEMKTNNNAFNANLILNYSILNWLSVSSQLGISDLKLNSESIDIRMEDNNKRKFTNLYFKADKKIGYLKTQVFLGGRAEKFKLQREISSQISEGYMESNVNQYLISTGISTSYKNFWDSEFIIGWEKSSVFGNDADAFTNISIGTSLILSEIINLDQSLIHFGKVRANYSSGTQVTGYPNQLTQMHSNIGFFNDEVNKSFETGIDLGILNRIRFSYSYFNSRIDKITSFYIPSGSNGVTIVNGDLPILIKGNELLLSIELMKTKNSGLRTGLIWSNAKHEIEANNGPYNSLMIGTVYPDWTMFWTNHFTTNSITIRTILGWNYGGEEFLLGNPPQVIDKTNFSIAELSLGYSLRNVLQGKYIKDINLSIVGRNLFMDYYKTDYEVPVSILEPRKNVAFNVGITF